MVFSHIIPFYKTKTGLELVSLPHCLHYFRKIFLTLYVVTDRFSLSKFTSWDIGQYVYCNHFFPSFKIILSFLIEPFSYIIKKVMAKFRYLENRISFQDEIKNIFHFFKGWESSFNVTNLELLRVIRKRIFFSSEN